MSTQARRHGQSPITWRARNLAYGALIAVCLVLFSVGLAYPERQPLISLFTLSPLILPIAVRMRFVPLVRRMKVAPGGEESLRFPFFSCDPVSGQALHSPTGRGWAELSRGSVAIHVRKSGPIGTPIDLGVPESVKVWSPHPLLYGQLEIATSKGTFSFQLIRASGTGLALADSETLEKIARDVQNQILSV